MLCDRIDGIENEAEGDDDERKEQRGDQNQGQTQQHVDRGFSTAHADYDTPQVKIHNGRVSSDQRSQTLRRSLGYVCCLWSLLTLGDLELHRVTLLEALVALRGNRAVVNKDVWPIRASDEAITLSVIEPLDGSFQTFHVPPSFRTSLLGGQGRARSQMPPIGCILERKG
jgi:hypothetical protein